MKKDCDDIRPLLDAWIDGELSSSDRRRVERHAEGCPDCREEAESRRGIDTALCADNKAGDPGDAYFATLGDRVNARFDFAEASRHWAKPERPSRKRRLQVPRAWVPRFAFGIAGVAVATIAGILVHDQGEHPILAPLPRVTDTITKSREPQMPDELPGSPLGTQTAQRTVAPSSWPAAAPPPPQTVVPSAKPADAQSDQPAEPAMELRRKVSRGGAAGAPGKPLPVLPPANPGVMPMQGPSVDRPAVRPSAPASAVPDLTTQPKLSAMDSPAPEKGKGRARGESDQPAVLQSDAEEVSGAGAAARSSSFRASQADDAAGADSAAEADSAADARMPGRPELLSFFGALSERREDRMAVSSIETISDANHEVPHAATGLVDPTRLSLRRDEAHTLADSTWIRLRRGEARALADSALATGTLEGCENALRAYWTMLHRDGRPLLPAPAARAQALESDRLRIAGLLRCASR